MKEAFDAEEGDLLLFVADKPKVVNDSLGKLRNQLAATLKLADPSLYRFVWITDFPLWSGMMKKNAGLLFTIPLPRRWMKICSTWNLTLAAAAPRLTTWS